MEDLISQSNHRASVGIDGEAIVTFPPATATIADGSKTESGATRVIEFGSVVKDKDGAPGLIHALKSDVCVCGADSVVCGLWSVDNSLEGAVVGGFGELVGPRVGIGSEQDVSEFDDPMIYPAIAQLETTKVNLSETGLGQSSHGESLPIRKEASELLCP